MLKTNANDWYIWGEWPGLTWFHGCYNQGLAFDLKKRSGFGLTKFAADYDGKVQRLYLLKSEWLKNGGKYLQKIIDSPKVLERDLNIIEKAALGLFAFNKKLPRLNAAKMSRAELAQLFKQYHDWNHELWSAGMVPNLLEFEQSQLSEHLSKRARVSAHRKLPDNLWQELITPGELSYAQKEEQAFLGLVLEASRDAKLAAELRRARGLKQASKAIQQNKSLWGKLGRHYQDYRWVQYGWSGPASTFDFYLDRLVRALRQGDASQLLQKLKADTAKLRQAHRSTQRYAKLTRKEQELLRLLRRILYLKTLRVDACYQGYYLMRPFMERMAKELGISFADFCMMHGEETVRILRTGKADKKLLRQMRKYSLYLKEGGKFRVYVGDAAKKKIAPIRKALPKLKAVSEISGQVAFMGKVRGRVKIINTAKDMPKLKKGDILVSYATDPSLLPAMQRAAAFVTDIGGLTAHAAIVARELKKPCIVGTKVATRVFKDNDLIEVDAEKGVARKIK